MKEEIRIILEEWNSIRKLTLDLLDELPSDKLNFTVGKNMGTIGKQYRHIGDVQLCYIEAIKSKKIDFGKYRRDYSIENSKEKLKRFLEELDKEMVDLIEKNKEVKIEWFGEKVNIVKHINYLIQHEILHHGELIVYLRTLGLKFPKSWELWGL
jgi:uncharacterized damage-inducible protein DinB